MATAPLYNAAGERLGDFNLHDGVFGQEPREHLVHQAVVQELANRRQGTHDTLSRSEVRGGGRKPYRQKGTGRARQGSTRAPHWRHGGIAHGPHPRSYRLGIPKKMRQLAKKSALNARAREGALVIVDALEYQKPRTKDLAALLGKLEATGKKVLVLTAQDSQNVYLSGRNIPDVQVMRFSDASAYEIMWSETLVVEIGAFEQGAAKQEEEKKEASDA